MERITPHRVISSFRGIILSGKTYAGGNTTRTGDAAEDDLMHDEHHEDVCVLIDAACNSFRPVSESIHRAGDHTQSPTTGDCQDPDPFCSADQARNLPYTS